VSPSEPVSSAGRGAPALRPLRVAFAGGVAGEWVVEAMTAVAGPPLPAATRVSVVERGEPRQDAAAWVLRGVASSARYTERREQDALAAVQPPLGRPEATCAALIPIAKSAEWWELAQDERRVVLEERSAHIATGLAYLPAIARRLLHGRDLGEPFDFLTWFEFAPRDTGAFDELVARLRATPEWAFVEREIDIRLRRADGGAPATGGTG
jgi:Chlorite dismutase